MRRQTRTSPASRSSSVRRIQPLGIRLRPHVRLDLEADHVAAARAPFAPFTRRARSRAPVSRASRGSKAHSASRISRSSAAGRERGDVAAREIRQTVVEHRRRDMRIDPPRPATVAETARVEQPADIALHAVAQRARRDHATLARFVARVGSRSVRRSSNDGCRRSRAVRFGHGRLLLAEWADSQPEAQAALAVGSFDTSRSDTVRPSSW